MTSIQIQSYSADAIDALRQSSITALAAYPAIAGVQPVNQIHLTPSGDLLVSSASATGNEGDVVLRGSIGPFTYEIHLKVKLDGAKVQVTFDMQKPIDLPPYMWTFDLLGIIKDASGNIIGASDVKPSANIAPLGLNFWCVLKCGGTSILACLLKCLPSLVGGPSAYVSCLTGCAGEAAAGIAVCVTRECI